MKRRAKATRANATAPKDVRDRNLSKDGKWRSFPKVPNLLQYVSTGTFYGRATVDSKIYRESLKTTHGQDNRTRVCVEFVEQRPLASKVVPSTAASPPNLDCHKE